MTEIRIDFGKDQVLSGMNVSEDGILQFFGEKGEKVNPQTIEVGSIYARHAKPPKVLTRLSADIEDIQLDANRGLLRFPFVFAVDTNTRQINHINVSVTSAIFITKIEIGEEVWNAQIVLQDAVEFHNATAPPERIGWLEVMKNILSTPGINTPVALIVDSDLGSLARFNARIEPLIEGFYLPEGIELIYGCGDRGTQEFIANAAIADCDRIASKFLERLINNEDFGGYLEANHNVYSRSRYLPQSKVV